MTKGHEYGTEEQIYEKNLKKNLRILVMMYWKQL